MDTQNTIVIKYLTKKFKDAVVLDNVNISFEKGKVHGLIGRNGSGRAASSESKNQFMCMRYQMSCN